MQKEDMFVNGVLNVITYVLTISFIDKNETLYNLTKELQEEAFKSLTFKNENATKEDILMMVAKIKQHKKFVSLGDIEEKEGFEEFVETKEEMFGTLKTIEILLNLLEKYKIQGETLVLILFWINVVLNSVETFLMKKSKLN